MIQSDRLLRSIESVISDLILSFFLFLFLSIHLSFPSHLDSALKRMVLVLYLLVEHIIERVRHISFWNKLLLLISPLFYYSLVNDCLHEYTNEKAFEDFKRSKMQELKP